MPNFRNLWVRCVLHPLQAVVVGAVFWFFRMLPYTWASNLGGWLARTLGPRLFVSERAYNNLRRVFPDKSEADFKAIVVGMWDNLGRTAGEYPHLDRVHVYSDNGPVDVIGAEFIDQLRDDGSPGVFFSGHLANWEMISPVIYQRGLPLDQVYRAANNPLVEWVYRRRQVAGGGNAIPKGARGARPLLAAVKSGRHLTMVIDQKMNDGISVPFFGIDAMTAPALGQLAIKYDCPVVPVRIERISGARFRVQAFPPMRPEKTGDHHKDVAAFMTQVNAMLEQWIRERPEQWLWLHNRWPKA